MIRKPVVAGQFYPGTPEALKETLVKLVTPQEKKKEVLGVVSPHAGYMYSGMVAGMCFSQIKLVKDFILLGPNHTGYGEKFSVMTEGSWLTPLGEVAINDVLAKKILENCPDLREDSLAHSYEHSLEVQLPFLQYLEPDFKIVPIILMPGALAVYKQIGSGLARAIKSFQKEVIIIASSDMTHYESQAQAEKKDRAAIEKMLKLDADGLMREINKLGISMCGYAPVITLINAAQELGAKKAELVDYRTSGEVSKDYDSVVGYAGMVIF